MTSSSSSPRSDEIVLEGELLIQRVAELKDELRRALDSVDDLLVNLMETTDIDMPVMQLFCSAHQAAVRMNKSLALAGRSSKVDENLRLAGFSGPGGCLGSCREQCLWNREREGGAAG